MKFEFFIFLGKTSLSQIFTFRVFENFMLFLDAFLNSLRIHLEAAIWYFRYNKFSSYESGQSFIARTISYICNNCYMPKQIQKLILSWKDYGLLHRRNKSYFRMHIKITCFKTIRISLQCLCTAWLHNSLDDYQNINWIEVNI